MDVVAGSTDVTTYVVLRLAADGTEATGLTITDIDLQYTRSGAAPAAKVDATALAATDSAHGDNQAIEIDATDQPGLYRVDWPDAAFASGVREVVLTVKVATCFTEHLRVNLTPVPANVTQFGSSNGTFASGIPAVNVTQVSGDSTAADTLELFAEALDQSTGQIDPGTFAAGAITAAAIADAAIDAATFAADVDAEILSYLVDDATRLDASALNTHAAITVAAIADQVWEEAIADHSGTAGSTAEQLSAAGAAGDPWATALPGAYTAGQAGKIVGDNLNATVSSRSSHSAADVWAAATRTLTALDEDSTTIDLDAAIRAAVGLASANLDTQLSAIDTVVDAVLVDTGTDIPATLTTVAGYLDTEIAAILEDTGTTLPAQIAALNNLSAAQVNAEVVDCLSVDTYAQPGQGTPAASVSITTGLGYLVKAWRNKSTQTSTEYVLFGDDGSTRDQEAACADDGSTFTRGEVQTGA
jgi:hypothetical protein